MKKKSSIDTVKVFSNIVQNTSELGKKVTGNIKSNYGIVSEKIANEHYFRQIKKYNPLFPEEFKSTAFCIPNIIVIVDDAVRREIEVCEGAIGWLGREKDSEILYLYDEAVEFSNIKFVPNVTCDAVYYVDNLDRNRFIKSDCIFSLAHQERLAELAHIAGSLGAKKCYVEINESVVNQQAKNKKAVLKEEKKMPIAGNKVGTLKCSEKVDFNDFSKDSTKLNGRIETEFHGNTSPSRPTLKWFKNDDSIRSFVDMICKGNNTVKSYNFELYGSSFATMSLKAACAIDCALKSVGGVTSNLSMEVQTRRESQSKLVFHIEF